MLLGRGAARAPKGALACPWGLALLRTLAARGLPHQGEKDRERRRSEKETSQKGTGGKDAATGGGSLRPRSGDVQNTVRVSTGSEGTVGNAGPPSQTVPHGES